MSFVARLVIAAAAIVASHAVSAVVSTADAQGSYYNQQNTQNRDYSRMQQGTQRAFGR